MRKIAILVGLMFAFSATVDAHHRALVNIEKAEKVFIKTGMGQKHKVKMLKCLVMLKKYATVEDALAAKLPKVKDKCDMLDLDEKKCKKMKKRVVKGIHNCFVIKEFFNEYLDTAEVSTEVKTDVVKTDEKTE